LAVIRNSGIESLWMKLLSDMDMDGYQKLYYRNWLQLKNDMKSKLKFAKEVTGAKNEVCSVIAHLIK